jgi:HAD superfamily phosphatase (TIGR01668 family)
MTARPLSRWLLNPHLLHRSIADIDQDALYAAGIRGILMDLDDTLCPRGSGETPPAIRAWLQQAAARFQLFIVSNNMSLVRVQEVSGNLCIPAIHRAQKPRRGGVRHAMARLGLDPHEVVLIGDRLLTDVLASRRAGIMSILVEPFEPEHRWLPRSVRLLEANLLRLVGGQIAWKPQEPRA